MSAKCALNIALLDGAGKRAKEADLRSSGARFSREPSCDLLTIGIDKPDVNSQKGVGSGTVFGAQSKSGRGR